MFVNRIAKRNRSEERTRRNIASVLVVQEIDKAHICLLKLTHKELFFKLRLCTATASVVDGVNGNNFLGNLAVLPTPETSRGDHSIRYYDHILWRLVLVVASKLECPRVAFECAVAFRPSKT